MFLLSSPTNHLLTPQIDPVSIGFKPLASAAAAPSVKWYFSKYSKFPRRGTNKVFFCNLKIHLWFFNILCIFFCNSSISSNIQQAHKINKIQKISPTMCPGTPVTVIERQMFFLVWGTTGGQGGFQLPEHVTNRRKRQRSSSSLPQ